MKIEIKKILTIKYAVNYYGDTEGGMVSDSYGGEVETISEAIELLNEAKIRQPELFDWIIELRIYEETSEKEYGL